MSNLIPFAQRFIAGVSTRTVSARTLHEFLGVGRDFSSWIKTRIDQYQFIENEDYILVHPKRGIKKQGGDKRSIEYYLTLDMAKELCMVERNDKGKQARRYFIDCERKLKERQTTLPTPAAPQLPADLQKALDQTIFEQTNRAHTVIKQRLTDLAEASIKYHPNNYNAMFADWSLQCQAAVVSRKDVSSVRNSALFLQQEISKLTDTLNNSLI